MTLSKQSECQRESYQGVRRISDRTRILGADFNGQPVTGLNLADPSYVHFFLILKKF